MTDQRGSLLPTIGRHVHYVAHGSADGKYPSVCRVAIVTEVPDAVYEGGDWRENTDRASLCVINPTGTFFSEGLRHVEAKEMRGGTWHWPCEQRKADEPAEAVVLPQGKAIAMTGDGTDQVQVFDGEQVEDMVDGIYEWSDPEAPGDRGLHYVRGGQLGSILTAGQIDNPAPVATNPDLNNWRLIEADSPDVTVDLPKGQVASSVWIGAQPTTTHFRLGGRVGAVEVGYSGGRWTIRVMDLGSTTRYEA